MSYTTAIRTLAECYSSYSTVAEWVRSFYTEVKVNMKSKLDMVRYFRPYLRSSAGFKGGGAKWAPAQGPPQTGPSTVRSHKTPGTTTLNHDNVSNILCNAGSQEKSKTQHCRSITWKTLSWKPSIGPTHVKNHPFWLDYRKTYRADFNLPRRGGSRGGDWGDRPS